MLKDPVQGHDTDMKQVFARKERLGHRGYRTYFLGENEQEFIYKGI